MLRKNIAQRLTRPIARPSLTKAKRFFILRGTSEHHIKEAKRAFFWLRLCTRFRDTELRLQLDALAHNVANFRGRVELRGVMADRFNSSGSGSAPEWCVTPAPSHSTSPRSQ